jgi:phosphoribosylformimino-5-aminoimidazole carboxamide ribotide isomerase
MQLVPVLEVRHGKCVHTEAKNAFVDKVVKEDVFEVVERWVSQGIKRIHLVDVDAIESGEPENVDLVTSIKAKFPDLLVQVLGGIKCIESAYIWIDGGADFLVLNGKAMRQRNLLDDACVEFPGKVLVELDCRQGNVGMGSGEPTFRLTSLAKQLAEDGVIGLVVTEVPENGHVCNSGLLSINEITHETDMPLFANGGIEKLADLKNLLESHAEKLSGVLIGKALHNGFCLDEASSLIAEYQVG